MVVMAGAAVADAKTFSESSVCVSCNPTSVSPAVDDIRLFSSFSVPSSSSGYTSSSYLRFLQSNSSSRSNSSRRKKNTMGTVTVITKSFDLLQLVVVDVVHLF